TIPADQVPPEAGLRVPPGLARLRSDVAAAQRSAIGRARPEALVALRRYEAVPAFSANVRSEEAVRALASDRGVRRIDLDVGGTGQLSTSVAVIAATERHQVGNRGQGVVVAILDSGIDTDHPDLADAVVHQACFGDDGGLIDGVGFCPGGSDRRVGPGAAEDDAGHGTFVSGIIASNGVVSAPGVAPDASIVAIKVTDDCSPSGCFYAFSEIVAALDYLITNNATLEVRAINMSFGTNDLFAGGCDNAAAFTMAGAAAINTLRSMGVIAFAAAGNDGSGTMMPAPACLSNVVSVGASDDFDVVAAFSNSNATTDIFAPGVSITSDFLSGGTFTAGGTSAASPHAAGCAALLIDSGEALTPAAIETRLETSPFRVTDPTNSLSFPRVDCSYSALAALRGLVNRIGTIGLRGNSASSYVGILNQAIAYLEAGDVSATQSQLKAFMNYVRAQSGKALTAAQADTLLLAATRIIAGVQAGYL
ncbi:MAG TPA: S8 family serine peptidase, partial [Gemmatimonadaceae bacterium]|nr:S8 family serine peptidase [Gemmatimonadaceae bacterium]